MSRPGESANPPVQPNVYLPYAETDPPPYEAYRDPAAAHGWENAYDETSELPRVAEVPGPQGRDPQVFDPQVSDPQSSGGRADRRRAARRPRRALAAVGAVGAVSVAALVAGFAFSGSPDDAEQGRPADTRSAPVETAGAGVEESPSPTRGTDAGPTAGTSPTAARPTASSDTEVSGPTAAASPSAAPATSSAPAEAGTTPTADSGRGNAKGRGKGQR
ncbi:hypothetical protein AB0N31_28430 [Streptomyces sp. NPDC051051]|uniref:hypothetical protein n=1 Tax=Streptomyces sp. NPDC051051 TaxID=3155666 RepID=UPI00342B7D56